MGLLTEHLWHEVTEYSMVVLQLKMQVASACTVLRAVVTAVCVLVFKRSASVGYLIISFVDLGMCKDCCFPIIYLGFNAGASIDKLMDTKTFSLVTVPLQ